MVRRGHHHPRAGPPVLELKPRRLTSHDRYGADDPGSTTIAANLASILWELGGDRQAVEAARRAVIARMRSSHHVVYADALATPFFWQQPARERKRETPVHTVVPRRDDLMISAMFAAARYSFPRSPSPGSRATSGASTRPA